jgi:hypothetical protein
MRNMLRSYIVLFTCACLLAALLVISAGCSLYQPTRSEKQGAVIGGATGVVAGALLDSWRGGVIGGVLGVVAGATLAHIMDRSSREAARSQKPVSYTNDTGTQKVETYPVGKSGNCHIVKNKYYENGQLVRETEEKICN